MMKMDRTVKGLLGAVVALLAVIAFRPGTEIGPLAHAQTSNPPQTIVTRQSAQPQTVNVPEYMAGSIVSLGYQVPQPTTIQIPKGEFVREIQVIDSAQAFLVRYDNRIEVYRVQRLTIDQETYEQRMAQRSR